MDAILISVLIELETRIKAAELSKGDVASCLYGLNHKRL